MTRRQKPEDEHRLRRRVHDVLEDAVADDRLSHFSDVALIALIVLNVLAVILETVPAIETRYHGLFLAFEIFSVVVFTIEYGLRLWAAPDSPQYAGWAPLRARLRHAINPYSIIDLLAILPFYLSFLIGVDLRILRVLRLLRFLKLARYSAGMRSLAGALRSEWRALAATGVVLLSLVIGSASAMYIVERDIQPENFGSIPLAMWWSIVTLTTVGYGDVVPATLAGRFIATLTMIGGLAMFALPIGIVATAFVQEVHRRDFIVTWGMVARVPVFAGLDAQEIAEIMKLLEAQSYAPGQEVVHRGDSAHSMYFIADGAVRIDLDTGAVTLSAGDFFGEVALLNRSRRTATVTAETKCNLLVLDADAFHRLMDAKPDIAKRVKDVAAERLRNDKLKRGGDLLKEEVEGDD